MYECDCGHNAMSNFGRANATGRSSGKLISAERKLLAPPAGEPWTWLSRRLLESDAWRGMSLHCRKFIDFLLVEHCTHAGRENSKLQATYDQLVRWGIPRKRIARAIREAAERGLVEVTRRGGLYGADSHRTTSLYRLTWIGSLAPSTKPTNQWRRYKRKTISPVPRAGTVESPRKRPVVAYRVTSPPP